MYCFEHAACMLKRILVHVCRQNTYAFLCANVRLRTKNLRVCVCSWNLLCFIQFHFSLHGCCSATPKNTIMPVQFFLRASCILLVPFISVCPPLTDFFYLPSLFVSFLTHTHPGRFIAPRQDPPQALFFPSRHQELAWLAKLF